MHCISQFVPKTNTFSQLFLIILSPTVSPCFSAPRAGRVRPAAEAGEGGHHHPQGTQRVTDDPSRAPCSTDCYCSLFSDFVPQFLLVFFEGRLEGGGGVSLRQRDVNEEEDFSLPHLSVIPGSLLFAFVLACLVELVAHFFNIASTPLRFAVSLEPLLLSPRLSSSLISSNLYDSPKLPSPSFVRSLLKFKLKLPSPSFVRSLLKFKLKLKLPSPSYVARSPSILNERFKSMHKKIKQNLEELRVMKEQEREW